MNIGSVRGTTGEYGGKRFGGSGGSSGVGAYQGFLCLADTTVNWAATTGNITNSIASTTSVIPAGVYVPGAFTNIVLAAGGDVIAYYRRS